MITLQFCAEYFRDIPRFGVGYLPAAVGSTAIRAADTFGPVSHVDTVLPNGQWYGARINGGVKARDPYPISYAARLNVWVSDERAYYDYLFAQEGKEYDWSGIGGFVVRRDWQDDSKWFCSELKAACLMRAEPALRSLFLPASRIAPTPLFRDLRAYMAGLQITTRPSAGFAF